MTKENYNLKNALKNWLRKQNKVVVAGIGNPIRSDDFVGVKILQDLKGKVSRNVSLFECETVPESFMQEIIDLKPSHLLLIDAAMLGLRAGEGRLVFPEKLSGYPAITTHLLPLSVFCQYIIQMTNARIGLLLIEPGNTEFGEGLTLEVQKAAKKITKILIECLGVRGC